MFGTVIGVTDKFNGSLLAALPNFNFNFSNILDFPEKLRPTQEAERLAFCCR